MYFSYGNYNHAVGEAALAIRKTTPVNDRGGMPISRVQWELNGLLMAATPEDLTVAIAAMEEAYSASGFNAGLFFDNAAPTAHFLNSDASIGGVRVTSGPDFPKGEGDEYVTARSYQIGLEADFPNETGFVLVTYHEQLSFQGTGGPKFVILTPMQGLPQRQQVKASTPYKVTQSGRAVGLTGYPQFNAPIWPEAEHEDERETEMEDPEFKNGFLLNFPVAWKYVFESPTPLIGNPNISYE